MENTFQNPILSGFHADPSICRVGDDYYLVNSSFVYFPGLPIYHSKDLVHWEQIGNGIHRSEQINFTRSAFSEGLWAPTIRWHNGTFYIVNTLVQDGREAERTNFVITAKDPKGPWSDPIVIEGADGIDSSLFFDDDGRVWYCGNFICPSQRYPGHHGIYLCELDPETLQIIGNRKILLDGASIHGKWTESPHIYKKDGYYYLMISEGGTFTNHCVMILRSKTIDGDYEICLRNPILTHRHLPLSYPIVAVGHADLVETQNGEWWMILLAVRPYTGFNYNLGRETFLVPVTWDEEGWPLIDTPDGLVDREVRKPNLPFFCRGRQSPNDHFEGEILPLHWNRIRNVGQKFFSLQERPGYLRVQLGKEKLTDNLAAPHFLGRRQEHMCFSAGTCMEFQPSNGEEAGLALVQSDEFNYIVTVGRENEKIILKLYQNENMAQATHYNFIGRKIETTVLAHQELFDYNGRIYLFVQGDRETYSFYYGFCEGEKILLEDKVDASLLSTTRAGGFVGVFLGLYATSNGRLSENSADFHWFEYSPEG